MALTELLRRENDIKKLYDPKTDKDVKPLVTYPPIIVRYSESDFASTGFLGDAARREYFSQLVEEHLKIHFEIHNHKLGKINAYEIGEEIFLESHRGIPTDGYSVIPYKIQNE